MRFCHLYDKKTPVYWSCFKIPEAAVNLQRRALGKRNNVKRLFKGEAYRLAGYGIQNLFDL
ncbi:MAG: hypothetical protein LBJ00_11380 [Planctomycetaceae bacterium]|nr:hypothetical protein [Planctomycetaceae bacterium]